MAESIELSTLAESPFEANDLSDYDSIRISRITDNEYVELKNVSERARVQADPVSERARVQADPVYANTTLVRCSTDSTDVDACISSSNAHTSESVTAENTDIAAIHRALAETSSSLKRVQITCIVLGIALVACSATLGALVLTMREKLHQSEQTSDNMLVSIGKLQAQTGTDATTNTTLQEQVLQIEERLSIIMADSDGAYQAHSTRIAYLEQYVTDAKRLSQNYAQRFLELERTQNDTIVDHRNLNQKLTEDVLKLESVHNITDEEIKGHIKRITDLEKVSIDSSNMIQNHTHSILELETVYNATKDEIDGHSANIKDIRQAGVENRIMIQNHADKHVRFDLTLNENSALINNHTIRIVALKQENVENKLLIQENIASQLELVKMCNASEIVIKGHTTRIKHLEVASMNSNILIQNHTAVIEAHGTSLADLRQSIVDNDILIQHHTAELSEIKGVQINSTAKIKELEKAIDNVNNTVTNYSCKYSTMDRHAFHVLRFKNVTYNGYDFLALEVTVPADGLSRSPNWCYDYQYLCDDFNRRPTGCGSRFTSSSQYSSCRIEYNSDMNIGDVLGCNPSGGVAAVANIAFQSLSSPAQNDINAFGFHVCGSNYCSKTLQASGYGLTYMRGFWQSNMTIFYTVCH